MSELDIPQISIARYLELLKRRWWSVIPVTVIGLIVGGVAAFLVPRYYVAETDFIFHSRQTIEENPQQDPMLAVAKNAKVSIPTATEAVLAKLGWPEATDEDPERRAEFVAGVKDRLEILPIGDLRGFSNMVNIRIVYKDIDGVRAMSFANAIRDQWIDQEKSRIELAAREEVEEVNNRVRVARQALNNASAELRNFREENDLDAVLILFDPKAPGAAPVGQTERRELIGQIAALQAEVEGHDAYIEGINAELNTQSIQREITTVLDAVVDPDTEKRLAQLRAELNHARAELRTWAPGTNRHAFAKAEFDRVSAKLSASAAMQKKSRTAVIDNPAWTQLKESLAMHRAERRKAQRTMEALQARLDKVNDRDEEVPRLLQQQNELLARETWAKEELESLENERRILQKRYADLKKKPNFTTIATAEVPPAPTDPNIALVAFAGMLVGLASAIGLILLLDFLQSSFKTPDDVQRALPVPVLGQLAHLETFEERTKVVAHRRRVSLAATVFLFLSFSVVTVYFVDPTKLPPIVASILDIFLGGAPAEPAPAVPPNPK
ncbi:MAG: hypothetical protein KDB80_02525 [Planctomycetes bacterium]|nr:hypothetical protein [Planctomycetota bacterium]